jgi:hypothetical protein
VIIVSIFKVYCAYVCLCVCVCVCIISELHSVEGQSTLPTHLQYERFCSINNTNRRLFAWRHLVSGQYVAQSGLHLHQSKTHSCKENKKNSWQEVRNAVVGNRKQATATEDFEFHISYLQ